MRWPSGAAELVAGAAVSALMVLVGAAAAVRSTRGGHGSGRQDDRMGLLLWDWILRPLGRLYLRLWRLRYGRGWVLHLNDAGNKRWCQGVLPPRPPGHVRCVCVSDTHLGHREVLLPDGDVLLHCGDILLCSHDADEAALRQIRDFGQWLAVQRHPHKVVIGGNHDGALAKLGAEATQRLLPGALYLQDAQAVVAGLRLYGSPISVGCSHNSAFQAQSGYDADAAIAGIPDGLDILLTHGSPGSKGSGLGRGSEALQARVREARPRYHVFGHWHPGFGPVAGTGATRSINVSTAGVLFAMTNPPVAFDIRLSPAMEAKG